MVLPRLEILASSWITCKAVVESKPVVGSSKNMMLGFVISSMPIDVRLR